MRELPATVSLPIRSANGPAPGDEVPSHYRWCFGCGVDHETGLHLRIVAGEDLCIEARFVPTVHHQGAPGLAHGGLLGCAFDEALGALNWLLDVPAVTAHLECDFLRPVPIDAELRITARIDGVDGRKVYMSAEGVLADEIAVRAKALFIQVTLDHFSTHGDAEKVAAAIADRAAGGPSWGNTEVNP